MCAVGSGDSSHEHCTLQRTSAPYPGFRPGVPRSCRRPPGRRDQRAEREDDPGVPDQPARGRERGGERAPPSLSSQELTHRTSDPLAESSRTATMNARGAAATRRPATVSRLPGPPGRVRVARHSRAARSSPHSHATQMITISDCATASLMSKAVRPTRRVPRQAAMRVRAWRRRWSATSPDQGGDPSPGCAFAPLIGLILAACAPAPARCRACRA